METTQKIAEDYKKAVNKVRSLIQDRVRQEGEILLWDGDIDNCSNEDYNKFIQLPYVKESYELGSYNIYRIVKLKHSDFGVDFIGVSFEGGLRTSFDMDDLNAEQLINIVQYHILSPQKQTE